MTKAEMTKPQKARRWVLKIALILAVLVPLIYIVAGLGSKWGLWDWSFGLGFLTGKLGVWVMALSFVFGLVSLLLATLIKPHKGWIVAAIAMLIPVGATVHIKNVRANVGALPFIHDITTDTQNPPTFTKVIMDQRANTKGVNSVDYAGKRDVREKELVSVLQTKAYPEVRPLVLSDDTDVVFGEALQVAKQMGWAIASQDAPSGKIEATATTFWYGFKDDIVIRVRPSEGGGTVLDIRSVSRVGASDMGANAARIKTFLNVMSAG